MAETLIALGVGAETSASIAATASAALPYIMGAGATLSAVNTINQGNQAAKNATTQAEVMRKNATAAEAASQRTAMQTERTTELAESKALATAAASGGGASDPTIVNDIGDIAQRGEYNAMMDLYNGTSRANTLRTQADITQQEGYEEKSSSLWGALSSGLMGAGKIAGYTHSPSGASLASKYGDYQESDMLTTVPG